MTSRLRGRRHKSRIASVGVGLTVLLAVGFYLGLNAMQPQAAQPNTADKLFGPIHVAAAPLPLDPDNPADVTVGRLTYLAGYELTADDKRFGGLSSLIIAPDGGTLLALSDNGYWVSMNLVHDGDKLVSIRASRLGVLGSLWSGKLTKKETDSESFTKATDGSYLVGFEETHRIWRYPPNPKLPGPEALSGRPVDFPMPPLLQRAEDNESLESLTVLPDGKALAILESPIKGEEYNHAWLVDPGGHAEDLFYDAKDGYSPTDLAVLPDGDVMVVERRYRPIMDIRARFRIIKRADIKPGALLDGTLVAEIKAPLNIDNMEGLAARRGADGATLIYVVADDNYSPFQRTLLMEFRLNR
ncbi:MAG TPA: esterase-like activity of phytase family protein [Alphaproteobacteria bacterium]|nr:esterase-like activity of phytase family protein [Alphaproteobacteria bacterium]